MFVGAREGTGGDINNLSKCMLHLHFDIFDEEYEKYEESGK